jgi:hypothetical protein
MLAVGRLVVRAFLAVILFAVAFSALAILSLAAIYCDRRVAS